jgi:hypothetical protein
MVAQTIRTFEIMLWDFRFFAFIGNGLIKDTGIAFVELRAFDAL